MTRGVDNIVLRDVSKTYRAGNNGAVEVLRDFGLCAAPQETVALVGPSACGKTTLLRLIGGLTEMDGGTIRVCGREPVAATRAQLTSFMFQRPVLLPWLTVRQNALLPGALTRDAKAKARAEELLKVVGLGGFEDAYPAQISGGMQSRAALVRAICSSPSVLLLDEPFGALDDLTRGVMQDELLRTLGVTPTTVVIVTHSIDEAVYLADRVLVLSARPATIRSEFAIELPRPRERHVKNSPAFIELRRAIQDLLLDTPNLFPSAVLPTSTGASK